MVEFDRQRAPRRRASPATGGRRADDDRRQSQVYPALDRQIAAMEQLRPTTPPGRRRVAPDQRRRDLRRGAAPGDDHQLHARRSPPARACTRSPRSAPSSTRSCKRPGLYAGHASASASTRAQQGPEAALSRHRRRPRRAARLSQRRREGHVRAGCPQAFATLPSQPLEIRRVPPEIQDGASNGYYRRAALDGSRPAIYFINLKDLGDWPKYTLPTLCYHEGVPGPSPADQHRPGIEGHSDAAQDRRASRPIPKAGRFTPSSWRTSSASMTATRSAAPASCRSFLFRAARLVVDTGMHTKRWSREQATDYMVETTGFARPRSQREVERYCTLIGPGVQLQGRAHAPGCAPATKRRRRSARSSTSGSSTKCCAKARCRCRSSSGGSASGRAAALARVAARPSPRLRASAARRLRYRRGGGRCVR